LYPFKYMGASMTVRKSSPHPFRTTQSEIDRRAIGVACHLLVAGIWLERQLGNTPKILTSWAVGRGSSSPATPPPALPQRAKGHDDLVEALAPGAEVLSGLVELLSCPSSLSVTQPMSEEATSDPAATGGNSSSDVPLDTRTTPDRPSHKRVEGSNGNEQKQRFRI
jgi:hypothetical protein